MWVMRVLTRLPLVGVDHQPRPFVDQEQVLILIEDVQLGLEHRQEGVLRGGGVRKTHR